MYVTDFVTYIYFSYSCIHRAHFLNLTCTTVTGIHWNTADRDQISLTSLQKLVSDN